MKISSKRKLIGYSSASSALNVSGFIALLTATLCLATGCQTVPTHAEAKVQAEQRWSKVRSQVKLQLARQQMQRGQFDEATKTLEEAVALDPLATEAYALLARANLEKGNNATVEHVIEMARKAGLDCAEFHYLRGVVLEQRDDLEEALTEFQTARKQQAKAAYLIAEAETLAGLGRFTEALALIDQYAKTVDDQASLAILGAQLAALLGNPAEALRRYRDPASQQASRLASQEYASLLAQNGQCLEAIALYESWRHSTTDSPLPASGRRHLAHCYLDAGNRRAALDIMINGGDSLDPDPVGDMVLAKAALACGEYLTALDGVYRARRHRPGTAEVELLLATVLWKRGELNESRLVLSNLVQQFPSDPEAWCLYGEVLAQSDETEAAQHAYQRALDLDPQSQWARAALGR